MQRVQAADILFHDKSLAVAQRPSGCGLRLLALQSSQGLPVFRAGIPGPVVDVEGIFPRREVDVVRGIGVVRHAASLIETLLYEGCARIGRVFVRLVRRGEAGVFRVKLQYVVLADLRVAVERLLLAVVGIVVQSFQHGPVVGGPEREAGFQTLQLAVDLAAHAFIFGRVFIAAVEIEDLVAGPGRVQGLFHVAQDRKALLDS